MRRIVTAFGLCALFFASAAAYATDCSYSWSITPASSDWQNSGNWTPGSIPCSGAYPGQGGTGDMATIDPNVPTTVTVGGAVTNPIYWALVDAETGGNTDTTGTSVDLTLKIDTGGSLTAHTAANAGYIQLVAGSHTYSDTLYADDANLWVAAGTLTPDQLQFYGTTDNTGHAKGKFDVSVTVYEVTCDGTVDTYMEGYTDIEFTNSVTVDSKDLEIGNSGGNSGIVTLSGSGTLSACSVVIDGGSGGNSTVNASNGAMLQTY